MNLQLAGTINLRRVNLRWGGYQSIYRVGRHSGVFYDYTEPCADHIP